MKLNREQKYQLALILNRVARETMGLKKGEYRSFEIAEAEVDAVDEFLGKL